MNEEFSPIESAFYEAAFPVIKGLKYQIWIDGRYRVDFYLPKKRLIIELDGYKYHSTPDQRTYDAQRDRYLIEKGFTVIRFTGTEINRDVKACVKNVLGIAKLLPDCADFDISDRDLNVSNPDEFANFTGYCSYMQKILNYLFRKYGLKNEVDTYVRLRIEGFDLLSVGCLENNNIYVSFAFNINGDRAVDPEIILHRYFDIYTNQYELIPLSFESYHSGYKETASVTSKGKIQIYDYTSQILMANYVEGMARRIEFHGFLEHAEVDGISGNAL